MSKQCPITKMWGNCIRIETLVWYASQNEQVWKKSNSRANPHLEYIFHYWSIGTSIQDIISRKIISETSIIIQ
jgi:hypothetical protein